MTAKRPANVAPDRTGDADDFGPDGSAPPHIARNLELFQRFMDEVFDDPSISDDFPEGTNVIFLPADDAEVTASNRRWGEAMRDAGKSVTFVELPPKRRPD